MRASWYDNYHIYILASTKQLVKMMTFDYVYDYVFITAVT